MRTISGTKGEPVIRTAKKVVYTAGRPPWYDPSGQLHEPFIIGISGVYLFEFCHL
jgi:uridine kinase